MIRQLRVSPRHWIYWGHEELDPRWEKCGVVEPFFWTTDVPPYKLGNGWRMKESPTKAFHIGWVKKLDRSIVFGKSVDVTPEEIGTWGEEKPEEQTVGESCEPPLHGVLALDGGEER